MNDYAVVIAARMTSTRLPGKVLVSYCDGITNLEQIVRRWKRHSRREPHVIVATSEADSDAEIVRMCQSKGIACFRGPLDDVVTRLDLAVQAFAPAAKWIARGMSDSPLVDVGLADWRLDVLQSSGAEGLWYGGDESRLTYAATTDVWSRAAWDRIASNSSGSQREHPGAYYWDNLNRFDAIALTLPRREYLTTWRTELDAPEDLEMFREIWEHCNFNDAPCMTYLEAYQVMQQFGFDKINAGVSLKTQSRALWRKGSQWMCKSCLHRIGAVISGDLEVRCSRCGRPQRFYATPPARRVKPSMMVVS